MAVVRRGREGLRRHVSCRAAVVLMGAVRCLHGASSVVGLAYRGA